MLCSPVDVPAAFATLACCLALVAYCDRVRPLRRNVRFLKFPMRLFGNTIVFHEGWQFPQWRRKLTKRAVTCARVPAALVPVLAWHPLPCCKLFVCCWLLGSSSEVLVWPIMWHGWCHGPGLMASWPQIWSRLNVKAAWVSSFWLVVRRLQLDHACGMHGARFLASRRRGRRRCGFYPVHSLKIAAVCGGERIEILYRVFSGYTFAIAGYSAQLEERAGHIKGNVDLITTCSHLLVGCVVPWSFSWCTFPIAGCPALLGEREGHMP